MTLPRRKPPKMKVREEPQVRCKEHLKWVRGHVCAVAGRRDHQCSERIEAAHVRTGTDGGMSVKPSDCYAIPLCSDAHAEQHRIGERAFELRYGIDMRKIADELARRSPHRRKWEIDR